MKILLIPAAVPLLFAASLPTQDPKPAPETTPRAEADLQSLQMLVTETVHARHATAGDKTAKVGDATPIAHDQAFARIQDAAFDQDGKLVMFVVTAPPTAKSADIAPRTLPAHAVRWDGGTRRWLLVEPTLQFAELAAHERAARPKDAKEPVVAVKGTPRYASELLRAELSDATIAKASEASSTGLENRSVPRIVWWLAPAARQLAVAAVPRDGKHLVIPFAAMKLEGSDAPKVRLEPSAALPSAPTIDNPEAPPAAALRRQSHTHYGTTPPEWEPAEAAAARPDKKGSPDGQEQDKG